MEVAVRARWRRVCVRGGRRRNLQVGARGTTLMAACEMARWRVCCWNEHWISGRCDVERGRADVWGVWRRGRGADVHGGGVEAGADLFGVVGEQCRGTFGGAFGQHAGGEGREPGFIPRVGGAAGAVDDSAVKTGRECSSSR